MYTSVVLMDSSSSSFLPLLSSPLLPLPRHSVTPPFSSLSSTAFLTHTFSSPHLLSVHSSFCHVILVSSFRILPIFLYLLLRFLFLSSHFVLFFLLVSLSIINCHTSISFLSFSVHLFNLRPSSPSCILRFLFLSFPFLRFPFYVPFRYLLSNISFL